MFSELLLTEFYMISAIKFLREVKAELARITWPTPKEVVVITGVVVCVVSIACLFFLVADYVIYKLIVFLLSVGG